MKKGPVNVILEGTPPPGLSFVCDMAPDVPVPLPAAGTYSCPEQVKEGRRYEVELRLPEKMQGKSCFIAAGESTGKMPVAEAPTRFGMTIRTPASSSLRRRT